MTTVTGLTAERMLEIEAASVVDGDIVDDDLILTKHDGSQINAGSVRGPQGETGPAGTDTVISAVSILDVGMANQIRAGRSIGAGDFVNMGLAPPLGIWGLSDLTEIGSGMSRNLLNKGAVPFGYGIRGVASSAARFAGSSLQALYISDTGGADPFRIKTGSFGCWFKTAKRGTYQYMMSKVSSAAGQRCWALSVVDTNVLGAFLSQDGTSFTVPVGTSDVADDRWHFGVLTIDGTNARLYVDGVLESTTSFANVLFSGSAPVNIGGYGADAATVATSPFYGRIDEAFITSTVLSEDQIRFLYAAVITNVLGVSPTRVTLGVRRRKRNAAYAVGDFPAQPIRLHNFSAGSLGDEGSGAVALTNNGGAVSVGGVDGFPDNAFHFGGAQSLSSTDTGLPNGLTTRSYGCWFKTTTVSAMGFIGWGTVGSGYSALGVTSTGLLWSGSTADFINGPFVADGQWHFAVVVEEDTPFDGVRRKLYLDGRLVGTSMNLNANVLGGANKFRIGSLPDGTGFTTGQIDGAFVNNGVFSAEDILKLYSKGSQTMSSSPKNAGDHIEGSSNSVLYVIFDTLESTAQIDLGIAG